MANILGSLMGGGASFNPYMLGAELGAGPAIAAARKIGQGRRSENQFVQRYEDVLGKQVLPQVIALAQAGNTEGAKQLLQKGVGDYYSGIQQFQGAGGPNSTTAQQSLGNQALHDTIAKLSSGLGLQYLPGVGFSGGATGFDSKEAGAKGALYGLDAPQAQGDPYGLHGVKVNDAPELGTSPELQHLLSGEGYSPKTLAQMKATAMEGPAQAGLVQMSQAKRALGMAGLANSPAAAALQSDVGRQTGYAQTAGLRDVATQNAQVANDNLKTGVGYQTQIGQFNTTNKINQGNLQNQYDWSRQLGNFNELNNRYAGATAALAR